MSKPVECEYRLVMKEPNSSAVVIGYATSKSQAIGLRQCVRPYYAAFIDVTIEVIELRPTWVDMN